ncbi:hypothetical protein MMC07_002993 [Pseudocyphellaria aurata]|nr:hypothetical protein [Pseudocyphellaria aurata]
MFRFINLVILSFLFFFFSTFAEDDCFWCPLGNGIVQGSEWLWDGAVGATEDFQEFLRQPSQPAQPNLFLPPLTPTTPENQGSHSIDDFVPLTLTATPYPKPPVLTDDMCNPDDLVVSLQTSLGQRKAVQLLRLKFVQDEPDARSCVATKKIIWPSNCGDVVANEKILNALITITKSADEVGISSNRCGTFFWTASLTEAQMIKLMRDTPGIDAVVPNTAGRWRRFAGARRRIERRDSVLVVSNSPPDLSYISTPPLTANPDRKYAQFSNSGRGVRVYIIDDGAVRNHKEFTVHKVIKGYLYGLGSKPQNADLTNHGNCVASKVGGYVDGVVKKADLVIVQIEIEISSLLDGLEKVLIDCQNRVNAGQNVQGYTVVQMAIGHHGKPSGTNEINLMGLIRQLVELFQVIVVLASEDIEWETAEEGHVDIWKEILHREPNLPIILVGAVDMRNGNPPSFTTKIAEDLTVSAPYEGFCADARWYNIFKRQLMPGNSIASAVVSGMVADLLSRDYIRQHLGLDRPENQNSIAQLLRDYVVHKAFSRRKGTSLCIWNGLYPDDPLRVEP